MGDAALAKEPFSGGGIDHALHTGATTMAALLAGSPAPIDAYHRALTARVADYLTQRATHYRLEQRRPNSPFWHRLHSASTRPDAHAQTASR